VSMLFFGLKWGIIGIIGSLVLTTYISLFINAYFTSRVIEYSIYEQFKDIFPTWILSVLIGLSIYVIFKFVNLPYFLLILSQTVLFFGSFLLSVKFLRFKSYELLKTVLIESVSQICTRINKQKYGR
jgi:hypothetical protein